MAFIENKTLKNILAIDFSINLLLLLHMPSAVGNSLSQETLLGSDMSIQMVLDPTCNINFSPRDDVRRIRTQLPNRQPIHRW